MFIFSPANKKQNVYMGRVPAERGGRVPRALLCAGVGTLHRPVLFPSVPVKQIFLAHTFVRVSGLRAVS